MLQTILDNCKEWENDTSSLLKEAECLFDTATLDCGLTSDLTSNIDHLLSRIESAKEKGLSLGFDFKEIPVLEDTCSTLQWCKKALSFCSDAPSFEVRY